MHIDQRLVVVQLNGVCVYVPVRRSTPTALPTRHTHTYTHTQVCTVRVNTGMHTER